jgi:diguanylate cyclase (GGDEF)-like protein
MEPAVQSTSSPRAPRLRPATRVVLLAGTMAAATSAIYALELAGAPAPLGRLAVPWWLLGLLFFLAETFPVHLYLRHESHSLSLSDLGLVLALFLASPGQVLLAQLGGAGLAVMLVRRQRPMKAAFNLALFGFTSSLALLVFHLMVTPRDAYGPIGWTAAVAAVCTAAVAGVLLVTAAIRLAGGTAPLRSLPFVGAVALTGSLASASLGVAGLELLQLNPRALWVLIIPSGSCVLAFYAYTRQRRRREHLESLYDAMRAIQSAPELRSAIGELLQAARAMLSAEQAEIVLLPRSDGDSILRSTISAHSEVLLEPGELSQAAELALRAVALNEQAILLPRGRSPHVLDPYLAEREVRDGVVTAVRGEHGITGLLLVGDRIGDVATFNTDDRTLLETFAKHTGVVLENDQVRERLRHQAFHDALTGLPNRLLFTDTVALALARAADGSAPPSVLFLDLDDFKTVNDSLGHSAGDELLLLVAERVRRCGGEEGFAARFGGDEFAILLPSSTPEQVIAFATELLDQFNSPLPLAGREIAIHPTIGIATADRDATTAEELLRNADIAMYTAKGNGKRGYATYQPEMHARARRRQELASALARALERDEIYADLQPIVSLTDGQPIAFEALARWQHPEHGLLLPGSFIPLAEETGATPAIARIILRESCRHVAAWQTAFDRPDLAVSVNLSPAELQNAALVEEVGLILRDSGLNPEHLILEITESTALRDPKSTIVRLQQLRTLGIKVALDDFGTGYSSLSHLRDLPIDYVKIAKPFIDALQGEDGDETLVKAILQIAETLQLQVIAEGIEHPAQAETLTRLNCQLAQGYHFSRPVNTDAAEAYLRATSQQRWRTEQARLRTIRQRKMPATAISG